MTIIYAIYDIQILQSKIITIFYILVNLDLNSYRDIFKNFTTKVR